MLKFLNTIFGDEIKTEKYIYPEKTPYFIRYGYMPSILLWNNNRCILLSPNTDLQRLPVLKKQLIQFQKICEVPCALCLSNLTSLQRRNLVESNIPFVSLSQQVYLPFWGCSFFERFKVNKAIRAKMAPGTQLMFLYLYYMSETEPVNITWLSQNTALSKATCTRAIRDLETSGLIDVKSDGTLKWVTLACDKAAYLKNGFSRMRSPIESRLYFAKPKKVKGVKSGMLALSELTGTKPDVYDASYAVSKAVRQKISEKSSIPEQDYIDFGGFVVEEWSYDPTVLAKDGRVDEISLLLCYEDNTDPLIHEKLKSIREKYGV